MYFTKEAIANDYDCDLTNRLKISAAMRYMQQTSAEHLRYLGLPYEKLYAENMVFLLSKGCVKVYDMPVSGQKIIIGTAPVKTRGARFIREFVIDDLNGNRLVSSLTMWLLVDPFTRKILRPASFPYDIRFQESALAEDIADIPFPKLIPEKGCSISDLAIRYSHIDHNNHVNNSVYADFVCDTLPLEKLIETGLDTMIISYRNEAKWGDALSIRTSEISPTEYYITGQKDGDACFEALAIFHTKR